MTKQEKIDRIKEVHEEQKRLLKKVVAISKQPPAKKNATAIRRGWKVMMLFIEAKRLELQKEIINATPITDGFPVGGVEMKQNKDEFIVKEK